MQVKIIFLVYRDWALRVAERFTQQHFGTIKTEILATPEELSDWYTTCGEHQFDAILMAIGWSWIIDSEITHRYLCLGIHPSDLPYYRGGSPIQIQIIDGITQTKCSLFRLTPKIDAGDIWGQTYLSLVGDSMGDVLNNVEKAASRLLNQFASQYPNISTKPQDLSKGSCSRRRHPSDSRISACEINFDDIVPLYNKIRCLTSPYPNAYIEDRNGNRIYFETISFSNAS